MKTYNGVVVISFLLSLSAMAGPPDGGTRVVAGEVVALSRSTIIPNWEPTARAASQNIARECYPIAAEAVVQLEYFYKILEIARTKVSKDDPIATGQAARKVDLDRLTNRLRTMQKTNKGCPNEPLTPKGN